MTWQELLKQIDKHNKENEITQQYSDKNPLRCVVVIDSSTWEVEYPLESRSYEFRSDEKFFLPQMMGRSIYADSLDGSDTGVRLDWYLSEWKIEDCYIK